MSTIKTNAILDASGGNTTTINGTTPTAYNTMGKNRIINGAMEIAQRGTSAVTANANFPVDRMAISSTDVTKYQVQQSSVAPSGFRNSLLATSLSSYSVSASDQFLIYQRVEGYTVADLMFGTSDAKVFTVSFWVRSSVTGNYAASIQNGAYDRSYPFSYTINAANTWEKKSVTITADTTGTWNYDNQRGLGLHFSLGTGSDNEGTLNQWQSGNKLSYSGATSLVATSGATFYITGVQLEVGSVATEFERRPYGTELALCQRYFQKSYNQTETAGTNTQVGVIRFQGATDSSNNLVGTIYFKVNMRTTPTMTYYAQGGTSGVWNARTAAVNTTYTMTTLSAGECNTQAFATNLGTAFYPGFTYGHYTASAEL